jgi:hypothetical protein
VWIFLYHCRCQEVSEGVPFVFKIFVHGDNGFNGNVQLVVPGIRPRTGGEFGTKFVIIALLIYSFISGFAPVVLQMLHYSKIKTLTR